jgi:predicted DNA binding CopG/RHH family protein
MSDVYIVRCTLSVGSHDHEVTLRVSEADLDAFLRTLRFNGVPEFSAYREGGT